MEPFMDWVDKNPYTMPFMAEQAPYQEARLRVNRIFTQNFNSDISTRVVWLWFL
jgi:hypothetical protein